MVGSNVSFYGGAKRPQDESCGYRAIRSRPRLQCRPNLFTTDWLAHYSVKPTDISITAKESSRSRARLTRIAERADGILGGADLRL